jgi:small subunit ribosomal protein S16
MPPVPTWRVRHRSRATWERPIAVAVKIKLKRLGKIRAPYYRIVVADARTKRDGRAIEEIGKYHPKVDPSFIEVNSERAQYWLSVGAQPTDPVRRLFEITGDWQKFRGLPGTEGTLKTATPKPDKKETFAAALAETLKDKDKAAEAKTDKSRSRKTPAGADGTAEGGAVESGKPARAGGKQATTARGKASARGGAAEAKSATKETSKDGGAAEGKPARGAPKDGAAATEGKASGGASNDGAAAEGKPPRGSSKDGAAATEGKSARGAAKDGAAAAGKSAKVTSKDGGAAESKPARESSEDGAGAEGKSKRAAAGSAAKGKSADAEAAAGPDSEA